MAFPIATLVAGSLTIMAVVSGSVGYFTSKRQQRSQWAASTWRDVVHRNGVTGVIPFAPPTASVNAPGLVRVYPRSHTSTLTPAAPTAAHTDSQVHNPRPRPASVMATVQPPSVSPSEAPTDEPLDFTFELSDPPHPAERARVRRVYQQGLNQTKVIKAVWGLSKGGGKKYAEARRRFQSHVKDIARPELKYRIEEAEAQANDQ